MTRQEVAEPDASKSGGYIDRYRNFRCHDTLFELFVRQFRQAQTELAALRAQLRKSKSTNPSAAAGGGYIQKYHDLKYHETLFELFVRQFELAKVDEAREGAVIQVVDRAVAPERKAKPRKAMIAIVVTLAAGFVLTLILFVLGSLKNSRHDPDSVAKLAAVRAGFGRVFKP